MKAFEEHLRKFPELLEYKENDSIIKISAHLVESSSQGSHLILYDSKLVDEFKAETDIFVDGTFKVCPDIDGVTQMLTMLGKKYNIVSFI